MLGREPCFSALLLPSIEECANLKVYTQHQALEFLESDKMLNVFSYFSGPVEKGARALSILRDIFLPNVPVHQHNFRKKCIYVAVMMRRMMEAILNKDAMDDKDYVGNKRLELSGQLLSLLFEDLFKTMNAESRREFDASPSARYILYCIKKYNRITSELGRALSMGNWDVKRFGMHKKGVTDVVARLSFIGTLGNMTKIKPQFEKSRKVSGPRALQPSQFGMLCPCDTPEGEACGLVKNLALMTHDTTDEDERPIISLDLELLSAEELHVPSSYLIVLNGLMLGKHKSPQRFANAMRKLRRAGKIGEFVSIFVNKKQHCVYIASDGGRVCRPLVIADKGVSRIKELHMKELRDGVCDFNSFLKDGLIEYLDVNEENNSLIALYEKEATPETTHIEIEPFTILGVCASLIPYPHHNQSPRNTYQCAMGSGQNATVAVMSYSGYDIEDAIVMNKSSLDRGFGRCIVMKKYTAICQKYDSCTSDRIIKPQRQGYEADRMQILDDDGIAAPGEIIRRHDIYINKESPTVTRRIPGTSPTVLPDTAYKPSRQTYQGTEGELAVVDRVALHSDENNNLSIKFMIRDTRRPEIGDKFSSRHGQKGVCGTIVQQEDLPFSERGICPELIMNPHGFPSRMTVGKMIELLGSKAGVSCGRYHYGSAFGEPSGHADTVDAISETLVKHGYSYNGKDFLYSGITDKIHARGIGPRVTMTRQPTEGRSRNGGLRVGEMERDCLLAYGASMLIYERLMLSSDPFEVQVCRKCGLLGYYNYKLKTGFCSMCKNGENISTMKLPYACKLLIQELQSMNIVPRLKLGEP
ncbi:DNA-directed RNA polymerase III subunit RPC2 [Capsicum annuum]|nr:DNA-directed RNA polymerase III subunit RPC2 [Capsicum annuum]